ncbi:hypothetical protein SMD11_0539 [Streptomyces albireticuli]|uniref:Uncharacterized protein n=1 Tax=Streptomyces albireticuli TaxID=1940 RepID=A0A1Z2KVW2_9ACTN|nr:hypothetical protein [Streptomyces albireticuli]ARZ66205.1 hypothetical protein SMD11_0539 [Streptomyces albireticuli]
MADRDDTLIVPVNVDALVVNQKLRERGGQGFRRWQPNFNLLRHNRTPEPDPFTNEEKWNATEKGESDDAYKRHDGVYIRWELPEALRQGAARAAGGRTEFPLVPNRWLVVRQADGLPAAGWVVESDHLDPQTGTSRFVHPVEPGVQDPTVTPYRSTIVPTRIGAARDIGPGGTAWSEPAATSEARGKLFLTAVGPGIMTFHVYQPYHENVFSLHDPLTGVPAGTTLNYQVVGWYSDPRQEELSRRLREPGATVDSVLAGLGWSVDGLPGGWTPDSTTYCGRAVGVRWTPDALPDSDCPAKEDVREKIAVGSSADEAYATLVADLGHDALDHTDPALLHTLGRDLLDVVDGLDGSIEAAEALHKGWFRQLPGGYVWRLADTTDKGNTSGDPASVTWSGAAPEHEAWLARLNSDQAAHDRAASELTVLQQRLYALWWMHGLPLIPPQYTRERLRAEIDPANDKGLAFEVARRQDELRALQAKIPHGADGAELERSLAAYRTAHPLPGTYQVRRETLPPFHQVTDPTVVLAGARSHTAHQAPAGGKTLPCRTPAQLVGGDRTNPYPDLKTSGLPPVASALLSEFAFLLDPADKDKIPASLVPRPWRQPWKPLLFQWRVKHWPVPYADGATPNWQYDGTTYRWTSGSATGAVEVTGRRFLVPLVQHTLSSRLERYAADHPDEEVSKAFEKAAGQIKDLDLLSQRLDGLTDAFALRDPAPNLSPPGRIGELVGDAYHHLPDAGALPEPFTDWVPSGFTRIRSGQFALSALTVVDEFGQTLDVLLPGDADFLRPKVGDSLLPGERFADAQLRERLVQLPPRLLQAARLRFDFVTEHDDERLVDLTANTTPVGAWIVPNYVDRSLLCYAPTGEPLGELRLELRESGGAVSTVVGWGPLPDSRIRDVQDLRDARPQLYAFARELVAKGPGAFADLMATVDGALGGIDPGNPYGDEVLGALLGRPLALVRARLGFELDGLPVADPGWQYALDWRTVAEWGQRPAGKPTPPQLAHLDYRWPIRLGNAGHLGDGLIGYFDEADYTTFHAVTTPGDSAHTDYVAKIGPSNWPSLPADSTARKHLTLLLDPQAAVHAVTDLLPVTDLQLPSRFTRTAMAAMRVALRLSPVLTTTRRVPTGKAQAGDGKPEFADALALPHPTSPQGTWDWAELTPASEWAHQPVVQIDQNARLDEDGPVVRTGFLRLSGGFDTK